MSNTTIERPQLVLPNESPKSMNIYQRMAAATADMVTVAKNLQVSTGRGTGYMAVSERDVIDAVKKVETGNGIYSYPVSRKIVESGQLESETQYGKRTTFYLRVETVYRFINVDKPDEYIEVTAYGDGMDPGDKATGKAMTYADKYALMKAYKISTGDDPDKDASDETHYERKKPAEPVVNVEDGVIDDLHVQAIASAVKRKGLTEKSICDYYKVPNFGGLTMKQWMNGMELLKKYPDKVTDDGTEGEN